MVSVSSQIMGKQVCHPVLFGCCYIQEGIKWWEKYGRSHLPDVGGMGIFCQKGERQIIKCLICIMVIENCFCSQKKNSIIVKNIVQYRAKDLNCHLGFIFFLHRKEGKNLQLPLRSGIKIQNQFPCNSAVKVQFRRNCRHSHCVQSVTLHCFHRQYFNKILFSVYLFSIAVCTQSLCGLN